MAHKTVTNLTNVQGFVVPVSGVIVQSLGFVLLTYSKFVLHFCIVYKCNYKFKFSTWICSY